MSQTFFCDCLNVTIRGDPAGQHHASSIPGELKRQSSFQALTLLAVKADGIKIKHSYLSLKRNISNWQINFCAVCEKETHAVLREGDVPAGMVLVSSHCSNVMEKMNKIMADPKYSAIFGVRIAQKDPYRAISGAHNVFTDLVAEPAMSIAEVDMDASAKMKQSLLQEQLEMEKRIKEYARKEHAKFEELCELAQKEKDDFVKMADAIHRSHEVAGYLFDKENVSGVNVETISYSHENKEDFFLGNEASMFELSSESLSKQTESSKEGLAFSKQKIHSRDLDCLFDMEDIEGDGKESHLKREEDLFDDEEDDTAQEAEDAFPVHQDDSEAYDQVLPLAQSVNNSGMRTRKMASSVSQNVPSANANTLGNSQFYATSLPIRIPRQMSVLTQHEDNITDPNDSIADRIEKISRSFRSNTSVLDDRPRRRFNTCDLIQTQYYSENL